MLRLVLVTVLLACGTRASATPSRLFHLDKDTPARFGAVLKERPATPPTGDEPPADRSAPSSGPRTASEPAMALYLRGILSTLGAREMAVLRASTAGARLVEPDESARFFACIRLEGAPADVLIDLLRDDSGRYYARKTGSERAVALRADKLDSLVNDWTAYRGSFTRPEVAPFDPPYMPSSFVLDHALLGDRFLHGRSTGIAEAQRRLSDETFVCRLPKDFDPKKAAGLLVWVNAGPGAMIPEVFGPALDELGIVCIGAGNTGNDRPAADRYQLALDAVATASERVLIDPRRVYATGISGGGKISSMTWACFPDVFAGAAPIVGLSVYENVPNGDGQYWKGDFARPAEALFRRARAGRLAPITGPKDFNYQAIVACTGVYVRDHFSARVFEDANMAHELPRPSLFADALRWVDEPYRKARAEEIEKAAALLVKASAETEPAQRERELIRVVATAPWSEPAWKACEDLKLVPE